MSADSNAFFLFTIAQCIHDTVAMPSSNMLTHLICRTAKEFNNKRLSWSTVPRVWYSQCQNLRVSSTLSANMLPQPGKRKRLLEPVLHASTGEEAMPKRMVELNHKRQAEGMCSLDTTHMALKAKSLGDSKGSASCTSSMGVGQQLSPNRNSRRLANQLHQVGTNNSAGFLL